MDQNSAGLMYLKNKSPRISDTKIKKGAFFGSQIRELMQYVQYEDHLSEMEKTTWKLLNKGTTNFWGKS